ncbi:MAG: hypothetical protein K8S20_16830 [Chloroflexi bacterium]|nr:hypothetical protein [Chloroflexota bacterium]
MDIHPELSTLSAQELTALGRELILAEKYDYAFIVLQKSLEKDSGISKTYSLLAYLLELHGNFDAADELRQDAKWLKKK